jgi:hypothetical protein
MQFEDWLEFRDCGDDEEATNMGLSKWAESLVVDSPRLLGL